MIRRIEEKACIVCGLCHEFCPGDVFELGEDKKPKIAYPKDCWTCFVCELVCPMKAIDVHPFRKPKPMAW